jgi:6-phosphogluconolactonase
VVFAIDPDSGKLRHVAHESTQGKTPRSFAIDPTGQCLLAANQESDNVVVFRIEQATGRLRPTGSSVRVPSPVCVLPDAGALPAANAASAEYNRRPY